MKLRHLALAAGGAAGAAVAVKMLTRPATSEWSETIVNSEFSKFTRVEGMRLHYQEFGSETDPPIILIHGFTASTYVWHRTARLLAAQGFRVLAIDLVGFGFSEKPSYFDYSIASQAHMVERFMDRLGIGRAVLVGSSYGGAVASAVALDHSARVEKLVLVGAVINDEVKRFLLLKLAAMPGVGELLAPFVLDSAVLTKRRMYGSLDDSNFDLVDAERVRSVVRPLAAADAHYSVVATIRNWHADRIERDAELIEQPTLIVWGDNDRVVNIQNGFKLHNSILNSRFVVFRNCGHLPQEEKAERFVELTAEFAHNWKAVTNDAGAVTSDEQ